VSEPASPDAGGDERPPIGGSWRALYATVAGALAVLIVLLYVFTRAFE
jgi:hypothetical protein